MNTTADLFHSLEFLVKSLHTVTTIQAMMQIVQQEMSARFNFNSVWLYDFCDNKVELTKLLSVEGKKKEFIESELPSIDIKNDRMMEEIYRLDTPVYIEDARIHPLTNKNMVATIGNRTVINCRLFLEEQNLGILGTGSFWQESVRPMSNDEISYFGTVSRLVASTINRINHRKLALIDPLTGINNKRGLLAKAESVLSLTKRNQSKFSLIYIDLNNFKYINDNYGHSCGDHLLLSFSEILKNTLREADIKARVGGDEFILLLSNVGEVDHINRVLKQISTLSNTIQWQGKQINLDFSAGYSIYPEDALNLEALIHHADCQMYQYKNANREVNQH